MSETSPRWAEDLSATTGDDPAVRPLQTVALDSRRPKLLDHHGHALQVVSGHADLFAVNLAAGAEGARRHLFRVESGEVVLDLPEASDHTTGGVRVVAVGGPGAEALVLPRQRIEDFALIEGWIAQLAKTIAGPRVDWSIREAENDANCDIAPGERRRGAARGVVWVSVERGEVRLMGGEPLYRPGGPAVPLASGMWIEAGEAGSTVVCSTHVPSGAGLWGALDQFHVVAMACVRRRLMAEAETEA